MLAYHFSYTDFSNNKEKVIKYFDKELSDKEINKELGVIIRDNIARSASLVKVV
jgi:hypothetical protein